MRNNCVSWFQMKRKLFKRHKAVMMLGRDEELEVDGKRCRGC